MFGRIATVVVLKVEVGTALAVPSPWLGVAASIPVTVQASAPVDVVAISVSTHPVTFPHLRISSLVANKLLRSVYFITLGADPISLPWLFAKITVNNIRKVVHYSTILALPHGVPVVTLRNEVMLLFVGLGHPLLMWASILSLVFYIRKTVDFFMFFFTLLSY